jgi:hypothetical protein
VSQDFSNGGVCQDTITGSGFTPGQEVNVFVFRQSPALTGPSAGGGKNDLTTQVTASSGPGYPGKFSVTFDDSDIGQATQGCGGGVKFIIEAQEMNSPSVWATSTYEGYPGCLL